MLQLAEFGVRRERRVIALAFEIDLPVEVDLRDAVARLVELYSSELMKKLEADTPVAQHFVNRRDHDLMPR